MDTFNVDIPARPIEDNNQAQQLGPAIAAAHFGTFTGQWTTVVAGEMSVVQVALPAQPTGGTEYTIGRSGRSHSRTTMTPMRSAPLSARAMAAPGTASGLPSSQGGVTSPT